ncbi:hypothetical protein BDY24DRAFT_418158 [Mrakia frigida]|uniref:uncharacterized protein n=1 Tax=Mrakia frigida TaxID=29902 RepID=UPI003FCC138F
MLKWKLVGLPSAEYTSRFLEDDAPTSERWKSPSLPRTERGFPWVECPLAREGKCRTMAIQGLKACGKCKSVRYCCREHQKAH